MTTLANNLDIWRFAIYTMIIHAFNSMRIHLEDLWTNEIRDTAKYTRIIAVGDLHGSYTELIHILSKANITDSNGTWVARNLCLIQIGDLMDRGPDSIKVKQPMIHYEIQI